MAEAALKQEKYVYSSPLPEAVVIPTTEAREAAAAAIRAIPRPAARPRVSAFSILGFVFIATLAVVCMLSYIELTKISAEITGVAAIAPRIKAKEGINDKLEVQLAEYNTLKVEYERAFDLKEIERYATQHLGMVRPQNAAEAAEGTAPADKAVIPASANRQGGIKRVFEMLSEYFNN